MNKNLIKCATLSLLSFGFGTAAHADIIMGQPVTTPSGRSTATLEFRGSSAGYTGEFYFLGWGTEGTILNLAPNTNGNDLGQLLFNNHESTYGSSVALLGEFESGSALHFAYVIVAPSSKYDLFRTDVENDRYNFAYDAENGDYRLEDLRRDYQNYDGDYNDAMFRVTFQSIPAPGSLALLSLGGFAMTRRRRR